MARQHHKTGEAWSIDGTTAAGASTGAVTGDASAVAPASSEPNVPPGVETYGAAALSWANPARITVALATHSISGQGATFSDPLPQNAIPLLHAAETAWAAVANVTFVNVDDNATDTASAADIRVGLGELAPMGFIGLTTYSWHANNHFNPGTTVMLSDVGASNITPLSNGNVQFTGYVATVFQDLLHEFGHALGLAHNPYNSAAIMNPTLTSANPYISAQDATALRALYCAPSLSAVANALADPSLTQLLPWPGAATV
jgi:predicted Zn-dependent protease